MGRSRSVTPPDIRMASAADGVRIAYQVFGSGDVDVVVVPAWVSHLRLNWAEPSSAAFLQRLAGFARVTVIDKRGTGCSERVERVPDLETRMDDLRAVLDAERLGRVVLFGESSGAAMSALFAATYPRRTRALVVSSPRARTQWAPDYPWGTSPEGYAAELGLIRDGWDSGAYVRSFVAPLVVPSLANDERFLERFVTYHQHASSRGDALALSEMWWDIDYRSVLPSISVPTLVIAHGSNRDEATYLAQRIPAARLVVLNAADSVMWSPAGHAATDAIRSFLDTVSDEEADFERVLATVLFTDIVGSTERAASIGDRRWERIRREHDEMTTGHVDRYRGRVVKRTGDGVLATFDGPARAIRCGLALTEAVSRLGIEIRAGLHTGEVELDDNDVHGITVAIAARVAAEAGASEVLVSRTVRDLVAGSGLHFSDAGTHALKGVPGRWNLFRAEETTLDPLGLSVRSDPSRGAP
jgi:class 3 adenylate cyclase